MERMAKLAIGYWKTLPTEQFPIFISCYIDQKRIIIECPRVACKLFPYHIQNIKTQWSGYDDGHLLA